MSEGNGGRPIGRQCEGHISSGPEAGRRCRRSASRGSNVCTSHGAGAGQVKAAAARCVAEAGALAAYERHSPNGSAPPVDVAGGLLELVAEVSRFAAWT